jgi:hypothetical protein
MKKPPRDFCFPDAVQRVAKRNGAPLIRDRLERGACHDPGSVVHHFATLRAALRPGNAGEEKKYVSRMRCSAKRCAADPGSSRTPEPVMIPGRQRITSLRCVLHCARETAPGF